MEDSRVLLDTVYGLKPEKGRAFKGRDLVETHTPLQDLRGPYGTGKQVPSSIC